MIVLKVWGKITTWKISKCPPLGRTPTPESAVPVLWTTYFQMLFLDYFLLSLKSLPPYYPGFHAQTLGGPSLIMRSDLVRLDLSFSWPVSSILPSKNTLWWKFVVFPAVLNGGGGRIRGGENFILQKTSLCENRIIQPQMSIVLRLRNPGIHKCLPSFRGLFPFIWMMQFWRSCGTYSLTNGKPFARLSLIFGAPIPWPHTKNGDLYQSGPILAWGCILQMHSCMRAWGLGRKFTHHCNDKGQ